MHYTALLWYRHSSSFLLRVISDRTSLGYRRSLPARSPWLLVVASELSVFLELLLSQRSPIQSRYEKSDKVETYHFIF